MAIAKLKLINITAALTNLNPVLEKFVDLHCFHPISSGQFVDKVHGLKAISDDNPTGIILSELYDIEKEIGIEIKTVEVKTADHSLEKMRNYISTTHQKLKSLAQQKKEIQELLEKYQNAIVQVKNIESMDISLDDIFSCKYVYTRVGKLPTESIEKLNYYRFRPFIFNSFRTEKDYVWCMYFTFPEYEREVDNIFSSLFFERIHIPDFVHGVPETAESQLLKEVEVTKNEMANLQNDINSLFEASSQELTAIKSELLLLDKINEAKKYVVGLGEKFSITGFVEADDVQIVNDHYQEMSDVEVTIRPARADRRLKPPTKLRNNWFTRPFRMFVEMYGLPSYGEVDATPFLAITYSLLFGIMFGDVGQGLLLILLGAILYKFKKLTLAAIGVRIGIFSTLFGFVYGSVFGNETILDPIYINWLGLPSKPFDVMNSNLTMTLLLMTVFIGAMLIITSIIINIVTKYKKKEYAEMALSHNGIAGLIFYAFVGAGVLLRIIYSVNIFNLYTILFLAVMPLLLVFLKEPMERKLKGEKMFPSGFGGFLTEGFFELFEVVLSYVTNTMSFMRVGGFVLSHAGMMLVVFALMAMGGNAVSSAVIFVFGNLFVMALEGLIVGIQVLRLEFYEMFSRYYEGNGIPFQVFE